MEHHQRHWGNPGSKAKSLPCLSSSRIMAVLIKGQVWSLTGCLWAPHKESTLTPKLLVIFFLSDRWGSGYMNYSSATWHHHTDQHGAGGRQKSWVMGCTSQIDYKNEWKIFVNWIAINLMHIIRFASHSHTEYRAKKTARQSNTRCLLSAPLPLLPGA